MFQYEEHPTMNFFQVNVIEETISYIDALHRRIAERFGTAAPTLSQEQVNVNKCKLQIMQFMQQYSDTQTGEH